MKRPERLSASSHLVNAGESSEVDSRYGETEIARSSIGYGSLQCRSMRLNDKDDEVRDSQLLEMYTARALLRKHELESEVCGGGDHVDAGELTMALVECAELLVWPVSFSLSLLGWQPFSFVPQSVQHWFSTFYILLIVCVFCYNYTFNILGCMQNDNCTGLVSKYIFPPLLHFALYVCGVYYVRKKNGIDTSRGLIEAVFLQSTRSRDNTTIYGDLSQMKLALVLRQYLRLGLVWLGMRAIAGCLTFLFAHQVRIFPHESEALNNAFSIVKIFTSLTCDAVYGLIITVYAIHCKLISFYVDGWRHRIGMRKFTLAVMKKEAIQIQRQIETLNAGFGWPISLAFLQFSMQICIFGYFLESLHVGDPFTIKITVVLEICTWVAILLYTLYQASTVTAKCASMTIQGVVVRNEGYMNAEIEELDSLLLVIKNLRIKATVFGVGVSSGDVGILLVISSLLFQIGARANTIEII
eukprot:CFRG0495T1